MSVNLARAKSLVTKQEMALLRKSTARQISRLTPPELKRSITQARRLRDKYRTLADSQRRQARGKQKARGRRPSEGNANTVRKMELFAEALERFEQRLSERAGAARPRKKQKKRGDKATAGKKASAKKKPSRKAAPKKKPSRKAAPKKKASKKAAPKKKASKAAGAPGAKKRSPARGTSRKAGAAAEGGAGPRAAPELPGRDLASGALRGGRGPAGPAPHPAPLGVGTQKLYERSGRQRIRGHVSVKVRHAQARRDAQQAASRYGHTLKRK